MVYTVRWQPADGSVEEELILSEETLREAGEETEVGVDEVAVADSRSLLDSPDGSISHADLG